MFTKAISFQKVGLYMLPLGLDVKYYGLKGSIVVANAWYVSCLYTGYLSEMFQGNSARPGGIPGPRGIQARAFSQQRWEYPRRPSPHIGIWGSRGGKRICSGRHLADATIFMVAASVLSAFNVTKAKDENGHEIPVKAKMSVTYGIVV